ncbi:MAG: uroporphyrinogen decarboxylase [Immundisolibacterales bacterium]|nr:uroporphyrinogen decarboxylase [Immundisolibacterales bacterium]
MNETAGRNAAAGASGLSGNGTSTGPISGSDRRRGSRAGGGTPATLFERAIAREPVPRRPLWIMRQAGRYLPEYRELRKRHRFKDLARNPELAAEVTLQPLRRFPFDAAIVFADIMSPVPALGVGFDFDPGPVVAEPLRSAAAVAALPEPDPEEAAPEVIEALRHVRGALPANTALLGFCGAPWTLAAYLVEGRGVKDFPTLRAFAAAEPRALEDLLARLSRLMAGYLVRQGEAGADAVQIFDSWAGLLSLADWERLIRPHLQTMLESVGAAGVKRILFVQNAPHLVDAYARLPAEVLAVDWRVDLGVLQRRHGGRRAVQGNIDPAVLTAGPGAARAAAGELLGRVNPTGHIVNLGHGILPATPLESVAALVEAVHGESA